MRPVVSHPAFAALHPTGGHPERQERISVLLDAFPAWVEARPALSQVDAAERSSYASATFHLLRNTLDAARQQVAGTKQAAGEATSAAG